MKVSSFVPSLLLATSFALASSAFSAANAASVSFKADDQRGSDSASTDIFAEDVDGGIKFTLTVNDANNFADLRAAFIDFGSSFDQSNITSVNNVLSYSLNENNIGGNIGRTFDLGVELTGPGASGGLVTSKMFTVFGTGLDVTDILGEQVAVRLQAVGSDPVIGGEGSAKQYGIVPTSVTPTPVPEPLTILGTVVAFGFGGLCQNQIAKKRKQAKRIVV